MGRALFSETYGFKAPAIRVAVPAPVCPEPGKWSISNPFDPDSDEFFDGAEYEAFMDQGDVDRMEHPVVVSDSSSSASSSDGSDSDSGRGSPVTDGVHDAIWDRLSAYRAVVNEVSGEIEYMLTDTDGANSSDVVTIRATADPQRPRAVAVTVLSALHPPSALRNSTSATDLERAARRASVPPISIPREPSTPGPASPTSASASASPSTPSPTTPSPVYTHLQLMTPSPAPPVTPRVYVWGAQPQQRAMHGPSSPSPSVGVHHPANPLTNPSARQSLARITPRRRAQNV
ncbi:hypothetical protein C8R47DRAFT_499428 [Mycena vitilis]|nr:hypothetical protein C8R47DRAFT_499428 [Mycena vitilis]